jgi:hypothetical protein
MAPPPPVPEPAPSAANTAETAPLVPPLVPAPQAAAPPPAPKPTPAQSPAPLPAFPAEAEADPLPPPSSTPAPPPPVPSPPPAQAHQSHVAARPAPKPAPQKMTRNTLPVLASHTVKQPNRTANNQGASVDSPGAQALNSEGAPPHPTNGPDPTTSTGGAAGEDGGPPLKRVANMVNGFCTGIIDGGVGGWGRESGEYSYRGMKIPARAHFFRSRDGTPWVEFYFWSRVPIYTPVTIAGNAITWTGKYGTVYTVSPLGSGHFSGLARNLNNDGSGGTIELTCLGSDAHPFRD